MIIFWLILTTFELYSTFSFGGSKGSIKNWLKPKTEPPFVCLSCPNPRNAMYHNVGIHVQVLYSIFMSYDNLTHKVLMKDRTFRRQSNEDEEVVLKNEEVKNDDMVRKILISLIRDSVKVQNVRWQSVK